MSSARVERSASTRSGSASTVYGTREAGIEWLAWGPDADRGMLAEFISVVQEDREPAVTGIDGLRAVEIVEAAYRSIAAGAPVSLEPHSAGGIGTVTSSRHLGLDLGGTQLKWTVLERVDGNLEPARNRHGSDPGGRGRRRARRSAG